MSSSQFAIFCTILIALFPLHEFVDGQGLDAGKSTCKETKCSKDKNLTCPCCVSIAGLKNRCFKSMEECSRACGKPL
ncbi:hypothetical protein N665_0960s0001 [Sinapis alba]|nr:hypothetical protein N665_0960s0001 [Sinapis alba]